MSTLRLFVALPTPEGVRTEIVSLRERLRSTHADVRWESDEKLHCTLKFLGGTDELALPALTSALGIIAATTPAFDVTYRSLGCFPGRRDPRIVWVGMEDLTRTLEKLHDNIETALAPLGFPQERRSFHPHVTLGRFRSAKNLRGLLEMMETVTFESSPARLREIGILKSNLRPSGSLYAVLKSFPLLSR